MAGTDFVLDGSFQSFVSAVGSAYNLLKNRIGTLANLTTTAKGDLVTAINEVKASVGTPVTINDVTPSGTSVFSSTKTNSAIAALINDAAPSGTSVYSSTKTNSAISTAVSALVASSPAALDTLKELADAMGDDANFATTMNTALSNRVRFDAVQTLTAPQKTQALANLGIVVSTTDYAAQFNTLIA